MKAIDDIVKAERIDKVATLLIAFAFSLILAYFFTPNLGPTMTVTGTVKRLTGRPTDYGEATYLLVELSNQRVVRTYISKSTGVRLGKTVELLQTEPLLFGKTTYTFQRYIEQAP
jgi:hypothetical protein|tara:strand:- start:1364 stop:1708 length:345 start_codon:yes stop_codon:yes gene_type:complete